MSHEADIARWLEQLTGNLRAAVQARTLELEVAIAARTQEIAEIESGSGLAEEVAVLERTVDALAAEERRALQAAQEAEARLRDRLADVCLKLLSEARAQALAARAAAAKTMVADVGEVLGIPLDKATVAQSERHLKDARSDLEHMRGALRDRLRKAAIEAVGHPATRERLASLANDIVTAQARVAAHAQELVERHGVDQRVLASVARLSETQMRNARRDLLEPLLGDRAVELDFDLAEEVPGLSGSV